MCFFYFFYFNLDISQIGFVFENSVLIAKAPCHSIRFTVRQLH